MMIDAADITKFDRTDRELEEVFLFWLLVAGKPATQTAQKLEAFLGPTQVNRNGYFSGMGPFQYLRALRLSGELDERLLLHRLGKYRVLRKAIDYLLDSVDGYQDLRTITIDDLEKIPGVGPKTARCFVLHSRPNQRCAALDTHVLKFLRFRGYDAPRTTPTARQYRELEQAFLAECDRVTMPPAELDLLIWSYYAGRLTPERHRYVERAVLGYRLTA